VAVGVGETDRDVVADYARPSLIAEATDSGVAERYDEMLDGNRGVRAPWREVAAAVRRLGTDGLAQRQRGIARLLADDGVTYRAYGAQLHQPWMLDPIPMLVDELDWVTLEAGVRQRAELLDLILTDLYGPRELLSAGLLPPEVVYGHSGFVRPVDGVRLARPRQLFLAAADLARDSDGHWRVIADRTQAPSGAGYAMENRRVVSQVLPGLYRDSRIRRLNPFFQSMRLALQQLAPNPIEAPRVVMLTPGVHTETAFDQAFLSALLGFPLVEGTDLTVREGRVWQHSIGGLEPVDVILRRVDAWFCDPLELRSDSRLGVPGLVQAARLGSVAVVNGLGSGVLENAGLFPFLPRIAEVLLSQPLQLPSAPTWWCGDELSRRHVLARLDSLVIKPISRRVARSSRFGWELSAAQREELIRRIEAEPYAWVGQQPLTLSTAPTATPGGLEPLPALLRTFAVAHDGGYIVLPGGLSRVAPQAGALTVSNQEGALAKDVWVLADDSAPTVGNQVDGPVAGDPVLAAISPRVAEDLFWLGRYAERAESAARLVGVCDNRWRDSNPAADRAIDDCLAVLLGALAQLSTSSELAEVGEAAEFDLNATARPTGPEVGAYLLAVLGDEARPGTVAHDTRQLRELATAVRDQLSGDTWAVLARLERTLRPFAGRIDPGEIPGALTVILETLLAFAGLAAESMVRDPGWHLLDTGRRIERALQVARLLHAGLVVRAPAAVEDLVAESVLIAAESIITHRRRYGAGAGIETVLSLLLFDRDNPRGVAYQLDQLTTDLRRIAGTGEIAAVLAEQLDNLNAVLREATAVALAQPLGSERLALDEVLTTLINELHQLAEAIATTHFPTAGDLQHFPGLDPVGSLE
jgi:uncharacterized circularly permuted ATP-grasp superfamily protein/uncharacterized alpha-E superfamily protein